MSTHEPPAPQSGDNGASNLSVPPNRGSSPTSDARDASKARSAVQFAHQSEKLSHQKSDEGGAEDAAVEARFVTPQDAVIVTTDGHRLPAVPLEEAHKLNILKEELGGDSSPPLSPSGRGQEGRQGSRGDGDASRDGGDVTKVISIPASQSGKALQKKSQQQKPTDGSGSLGRAMPPSHTNPLFPPLPLYGPPSLLRNLQCTTFRVSAFFLSLAFLGVIVLGSLFTSLPPFCYRVWLRLTFRNPDSSRPFYEEEQRRKVARKETGRSWRRRRSQGNIGEDKEGQSSNTDGYVPAEGGPDPIKCDVGYYARRVGLDVEEFEVQTEDGFIIALWHVYDPKEYKPLGEKERAHRGPDIFTGGSRRSQGDSKRRGRRFPVLLIHGLLQSSGAYCVNDDDSLAFFLCKSGFDVWLGNNRCGFQPRHVLLEYTDPRMWCWNIRQMGVFDLPALTSRVLYETGFRKVGLVAHSQGTTETLVALAKGQRPELGERLTVFCALAPAAYAGPLIGKMYFKFMRVITPAMFRLMFGIHAFIPLMMTMHGLLPPRAYGWLGYRVFSFLFGWTDARWDRGLRDRMFQFAPVYVSSESMRWWLGRECFARHKCILATKEEWRAEEREDNEAENRRRRDGGGGSANPTAEAGGAEGSLSAEAAGKPSGGRRGRPKGATAWYNEQAPPFALWVCGNDKLVDGRRLLRRFERGREPHVRVVHSKVIADFEHLDVIWAMDAVDEVFKEVREALWKTCDARSECRVPKGCEDVHEWEPAVRGFVVDDDDSGESSGSSKD